MDRWTDNRAWFLLLPALAVLAVVGGLPLLAVINYGLHDIFTLSQIHWVGLQWFADILVSDRFWASLALAIVFLLRCVDSLVIYTEAFAINAGQPNDATRFLSLDLGEEIKGFSYGQAAARAYIYFLIVLSIVWVFVIAARENRRPQ